MYKDIVNLKNQDFDFNNNILLSLSRGSSWNNLYEPYKFEGTELSSSILNIIMAYRFAIIELKLYLDTHPTCEDAKNLLNKLYDEYHKAKQYNKIGDKNVGI